MAEAARTYDLCLTPQGVAVEGDRSLAEAVLFGSGRPVLLYPDDQEIAPGSGIGKVAIAWDGSARAARAVADALPLLARASEVRVFVALGEKPQAKSEARAICCVIWRLMAFPPSPMNSPLTVNRSAS